MNSFISSLRNYPERKIINKDPSENKSININTPANDDGHIGGKEIEENLKSIELVEKYRVAQILEGTSPNTTKVVSLAPNIPKESKHFEKNYFYLTSEKSASNQSFLEEKSPKKYIQLDEDSLENMSKSNSKDMGSLEKSKKKLNPKPESLDRKKSNEKIELVPKYKGKIERQNSQTDLESLVPKSKSQNQKVRETSSGERSKKEYQPPHKSPSKKKYDNESIENVPSRHEAVSMINRSSSLHHKFHQNEVQKKKSEKMLHKTSLYNPSYFSQHNNALKSLDFHDYYPAKHQDMKFKSRNITAHNACQDEEEVKEDNEEKNEKKEKGKKKCKDPTEFLMELMQGCLCKKLMSEELPPQQEQKSRFSTYDACPGQNTGVRPGGNNSPPDCCGDLVNCLLKSLVAKGCCDTGCPDGNIPGSNFAGGKVSGGNASGGNASGGNAPDGNELDKIRNQQCCLEQEMNKLKSSTIVFLKEAMDKRAESKMLEMKELMASIEKKKQAYLLIVGQKLSNQEAELNQLRALQEENQAFICEQQQIINKQMEIFQEKEQAIRECADLQIEELNNQHKKDMENEKAKLMDEMTSSMLENDKNSQEKIEELQQKVLELTQEIQNQERMLQQVAADCQTKIFEQEQEFCQERMRFQAEMQEHIIQRKLLEQHACSLEREKEKMEQEIKGLTSCDFDKLFKKACQPPCKPSCKASETLSNSCASTCSRESSANDSQRCYKYPDAKSWGPEKSCESKSGLKCKLDLSQFKVPFHCRGTKNIQESKTTTTSIKQQTSSHEKEDEVKVSSHACCC